MLLAADPLGITAGYAFNEVSGTAASDASGHSITGTLVNGPTFATGKYGNALALDGVNDYVNLGNPTALQLTGSMTVSAWIYSTAFPVDDAAIVSKRTAGESGFQLDTTVDTGTRTIGFKLTNSSSSAMFRYGATALQPNTWYYVTGVYNASARTLDVYLNGQLDNGILLGTVTASQQNSSANVTIGRRSGLTGFEFAGRIDDVRIANHALTQDQIQTDMATPLTSVATGPDTISPVVAHTAPAAGPVSGVVTVSATASDNVGVAGVQFLLDGVALGAEDTTSPYSVSWDTSTATNGTHTLAARARDAAGNTAIAPTTIFVDNQAPSGTVVINGGAAATKTTSVTLTLSAADPLSGVTQMRFSNTGTSFSTAEAYATTKSWTLLTGAGTKTVYVQFKDAAGNWSTSATDTIVLDTTAPTISARTATGITNNSSTITWTTNEPATSLVEYGLTTSYGSSTALDSTLVTSHSLLLTGLAANTTYNYRVRSIDAAGNESVSANSTFKTAAGADTTAPTVQSINRTATSPTKAASVSWTVVFSESVTGVDSADFALVSTGNLTGAAITTVSGSGTQYTVTANTGTGDGALGLNLVDNDTIVDTSANRLGGAGSGNGNFTGQIYTVDKTAPSSTISQAAAQVDPANTSPINFTASFNETVTGFSATGISFAGSTASGTLTALVTGSGQTYNVAVSGMTGSGSVVVSVLAGAATDAAGNASLASAAGTDNSVSYNISGASSFRNEILATGFENPTAIKFLPDGRMLVAELDGAIRILSAPYTQADPTPFLQITNVGSAVDSAGGAQQGIYDIALDPNFSTNHYFYVSYTAGTPNHDRLSRFTANAALTGTIAGSEFIIYENPQNANQEHHGGAINFGNDGKIYFTTGEDFQGNPAQDLTSSRGKILRFNPDGTIPTDNPFYDGNGPNYDAIWALGLRNPYRAYYDAPTGRLLIGDVGGNDYSTAKEELNVGVRGANYGWPNVEGTTSNPAYTNPIYSYAHNGRDAAITGGFVYHGSQFPSSYQGSYFFADYSQNWIKRLTFDANGNVNGVFNFEPSDGAADGPTGDVVYLTEGPEGALYYIDLGFSDTTGQFGVSKIRRISFVTANQPPVVSAAAAPTSKADPPFDISFSSAGSSDPEGQPLTYSWNFGDGTAVSSLANPVHTYASKGMYQARLTVSDGVNSTVSAPLSISIGTPPVVTSLLVTVPPNASDNGLFRAGDVISFNGTATDADGTLSAANYTWTVDFLHEGHVHPGTPVSGVTSGTFTIPTSGHDFSGNTRYRITLTVTDSDGLQSSQSTIIYPDKVNLSFATAPAGLTLYLDGIGHTGPFVYDTLIGFNHTIEARNQTAGGSTYNFVSWSDGGTQQHTIVVPSVAPQQPYTANYNTIVAGPTAAYAFNETAGTTTVDATGSGLTGMLTNGPVFATGKNGNAIRLDGADDYVDLGNPTALQLTGSMTVSAWIYSSAFPFDDAAIVSKRTGTESGFQLDTTVDTGNRTIGFKLTNSAGGQMFRYGATTLQANSWYFVTGVYDAAAQTIHVYLNGQLDDGVLQGTVTSTQQNSTANVNVGRRPGNPGIFNFKGLIDDVRIYKRPLTVAEIQADMITPVIGGIPST